MKIKAFEEYASLSTQIKELEAKRAALKPVLVENLKKTKDGKEDLGYGVITLYPTTTWKYSEAIVDKEEKLKIAKVREQEKGIAKAVVSESVRFTPKKDDSE